MSTTSITDVLSELFSAPLEAAVNAEIEYRRIWAKWLSYQRALITEKEGDEEEGSKKTEQQLLDLLKTAPEISIDGVINLEITMRIAGVRETSVGFGGGLSLGPIYGSGNYGFMNRATEESVFRANAKFTLTNASRNLTALLEHNDLLPLTKAEEVKNAIAELEKPPMNHTVKIGAQGEIQSD